MDFGSRKRRLEEIKMAEKKLLELRMKSKARKPTFLRQDANRNKSLVKNWRRPKGMHSKMRLHLRGRRASPSPGYSSPRKVRGLTRNGFEELLVKNVNDLTRFDAKRQIVVVAHVGLKNKIAILKACLEKKYLVGNVKDVSSFIQKVDAEFASKKKKKKETQDTKKKVKEEDAKKVEKKVDKKENGSAEEAKTEETKKGEKSEKIKVLEKKQ